MLKTKEELQFKIDNFEGPLDLLLELIRRNKMEIENVELSKITGQYLELMEGLSEVDLERASEFIEIAASLIEIKSRALLPRLDRNDKPEDDPEALLLQRLQEYKLFKEQTERLKPLENVDRFYKNPELEAGKFRIVLKDMQIDMLLNAFTKLLTRVNIEKEDIEPKQIKKEQFTVGEKISIIKDSLTSKKRVLFSELFTEAKTRDEIITTFLAILELLKLQEIKCKQKSNFEDIEISKNEE